MIGIAVSKNGIPVRLTEERWFHIVENHDELAGLSDEVLLTVEDPDFIVKGWIDELLAIRKIDQKHIVVVYKEVGNDGFARAKHGVPSQKRCAYNYCLLN